MTLKADDVSHHLQPEPKHQNRFCKRSRAWVVPVFRHRQEQCFEKELRAHTYRTQEIPPLYNTRLLPYSALLLLAAVRSTTAVSSSLRLAEIRLASERPQGAVCRALRVPRRSAVALDFGKAFHSYSLPNVVGAENQPKSLNLTVKQMRGI